MSSCCSASHTSSEGVVVVVVVVVMVPLPPRIHLDSKTNPTFSNSSRVWQDGIRVDQTMVLSLGIVLPPAGTSEFRGIVSLWRGLDDVGRGSSSLPIPSGGDLQSLFSMLLSERLVFMWTILWLYGRTRNKNEYRTVIV